MFIIWLSTSLLFLAWLDTLRVSVDGKDPWEKENYYMASILLINASVNRGDYGVDFLEKHKMAIDFAKQRGGFKI